MLSRAKIDNLELTDFRGDYDALAAMMIPSWRQDSKHTAPLFSGNLLRSWFAYPGASTTLAPTLYKKLEPVAFVAGFPRTVQYEGSRLRLTLNTFLTTAASAKGHGYGRRVWKELFTRVREQGYDGAINFCVEGGIMNNLMMPLSQSIGVSTGLIHSVRYLAKFLSRVPTRSSFELENKQIPNPQDFLEMANGVTRSVALARLWTRPEAEWQCQGRLHAVAASLEVGTRRGIVTGYIMRINDDPIVRCFFLEDLLWGTLESNESAQLVDRILALGASHGAIMAVVPILGYASTQPLFMNGFRQFRRVIHCYLSFWQGVKPPQPMQSLYMDVF